MRQLRRFFQNTAIIVVQGGRTIQDDEGQVRIGQCFEGPADSDTLDVIRRVPHTRRVCETQRNTVHVDGLGQNVTRRPWNARHDRTIRSNQTIEETRFSDIGLSKDRQLQAAVQNFPVVECLLNTSQVFE